MAPVSQNGGFSFFMRFHIMTSLLFIGLAIIVMNFGFVTPVVSRSNKEGAGERYV
jgi:hypothetical protein